MALSSVLSIDIEWSSSFRGRTYGPVTAHVIRNGNDFTSNGVTVPAAAVQALIDALQAPAISEPAPEALGFAGTALSSMESSSAQACSGVTATQAAQDVYDGRFTDATAFAGFLRSYYAKPPVPDTAVPMLRIVASDGSGQIIASSSSSKAGMLPFTVARDGTSITTYNASLAQAAAAVLGRSPASMLLSLDSLSREWAVHVCDNEMTDLAFHDALPGTITFAQSHGLVIHGTVNGNPVDSLTANVSQSNMPRITMLYNADVRGGDAASVMVLRYDSNALHGVAVIPWLQRVLATHPGATVEVDDPSMNGGILEALEVDQMRHAGFDRAASLLASNFRTAVGFWVWLKPGKEPTHWYLLPNGDAVLMHYLPSETRLPLDARTNALIRRRGKPLYGGPSISVGAVVTPQGALEP